MIAYKLFRELKNGDISPLFINKRLRLKYDTWYEAECHPTKGFAVRPGWHASLLKRAPHLSKKNRVWKRVEVEDCELYQRPANQGGVWVLAKRMKVMQD
jgi:hypothetical protein